LKAPSFAYAKPRTLAEALELLARHGEGARILAGGQSLIPSLNMRLSSPKLLVDITGLPGLAAISLQGGVLTIGGAHGTRRVRLADYLDPRAEESAIAAEYQWIKALRLWIVRYDDRFIAISAICTHLGCTPRYLGTEDKYKCPCHGSGYRGFASGWKVNATNFEGPAPRPMERFKLALADDGQMVVDKSATFRIDKLEFDKPGAYLPFA